MMLVLIVGRAFLILLGSFFKKCPVGVFTCGGAFYINKVTLNLKQFFTL